MEPQYYLIRATRAKKIEDAKRAAAKRAAAERAEAEKREKEREEFKSKLVRSPDIVEESDGVRLLNEKSINKPAEEIHLTFQNDPLSESDVVVGTEVELGGKKIRKNKKRKTRITRRNKKSKINKTKNYRKKRITKKQKKVIKTRRIRK